MTSPQKQEGQHDAEADSGLPGNPLASQVRDAPKPEDVTTDAMTLDPGIRSLEGILVRGETDLAVSQIVARCQGIGRQVLGLRGVSYLGGQWIAGRPGIYVGVTLFSLLLR